MATFNTEGIIIKRSNFGEADRLLTILTPFKGKIKVIAKGVRRITSRRGGNVELLNQVRIQLFQGTGLYILTEAESLETFQKIKSDLVLTSYASHVLELIDKLLPEGQINPNAYKLLAAILTLLEKNPRQIFVRAFEVKIFSDLGFWSVGQIDAEDKVKHLLTQLETGSWQEINNLQIPNNEILEVERILRYYMERTLEGSLKSLQMLKKVNQLKL